MLIIEFLVNKIKLAKFIYVSDIFVYFSFSWGMIISCAWDKAFFFEYVTINHYITLFLSLKCRMTVILR